MKTYKNIESLKNIIKADSYNEIELVKYGVQAYGVDCESEYNVIVKAEKTNGRYFFTTREGYRVAWSTIDAEYLDHVCADFLAQLTDDEERTTPAENVTKFEHLTAARVAELGRVLADGVGVAFDSTFPAYDMAISIDHFTKWQEVGRLADYSTDPRAPFYMAIRKQGTESGTREHVIERCRVLGAPLYVLKVEREKADDGGTLAGRFTLTVKADPTDPTTCEPSEPAEVVESIDTKADTCEAVSEPVKVVESIKNAARVFVLAFCLTAAPVEVESIESEAAELTEIVTAEPLRVVADLLAALPDGQRLAHVTIKNA
jgi:hypothetical protein